MSSTIVAKRSCCVSASAPAKALRRRKVVTQCFLNGSNGQLETPKNVLEARCWISAWRFKNAKPVTTLEQAIVQAAEHYEGSRDLFSLARAEEIAIANATTTVKFSIKQKLQYGQSVKLVGEADAMGAWDPKNAPGLDWSNGNVWTKEMVLKPGKYQFKCVAFWSDSGDAEWEDGPNRVVQVPLKLSGEQVEVVLEPAVIPTKVAATKKSDSKSAVDKSKA